MSASLATIPKRARVIRYAHATHGERSATFTVYADDVSLGYQSDYQPTAARWYALEASALADGRPFRRCWRYTGARIGGADQDYRRAVADARRCGWTVTE
jgi:hypothetical protein